VKKDDFFLRLVMIQGCFCLIMGNYLFSQSMHIQENQLWGD
jgi:hypothetical protein